MKKLYLPILFSLSLFNYCHAQKWIPQGLGELPDSFGIIGLTAVDDSTVWALAFDLVPSASTSNFSYILIKSTDGGDTWDKYVLDQFNNQFLVLSAISSDVAWLAASDSQGVIFYKTEEGGESWVPKFIYNVPNGTGSPILKFVDEDRGYFIDFGSNRSGGTESGGEIWYSNPTSITLPPNEFYGYPSPGNWFEAKGDTLIFGTSKRIFRSINGGMSWATVHTFASNHEIHTVAFDDTGYGLTGSDAHSTQQTGFSLLDSTVFLKSEDFGMTWDNSIPAADFPLTSLAQIPGESKTFIGVSGVSGWFFLEQLSWASAYTTDGGVTWDTIDRDIPYSCISFVSMNTGWVGAVGNHDYGLGSKPAVFKWEPPAINSTKLRESESGITVSPNPFSTNLKIESEKLQVESVTCFNTQGQRMAAISTGEVGSYDFSKLPPGIYFLQIQTDGGVVTKKVVKN